MKTFNPFPANLNTCLEISSYDYHYFYHLCQAVKEEQSYFLKNKWLITRAPGKYHKTRWLTLFSRALRIYVQMPQDKLIPELKHFTAFVLNALAPAWFYGFTHPSFLNGIHILQMLVKAVDDFEMEEHEREVMEDSLTTHTTKMRS